MVGIEIDKITNSIEFVATGQSFETEVVRILPSEVAQIKTSHWLFDWKSEVMVVGREVYKLVTLENRKQIQGLVSIADRQDHVFLNLIESAKANRGKGKTYFGVPANLFAFACKAAFERGYDGVVAFTSKTKLVSHYQKYFGAKQLKGNELYIDTNEARLLVNSYYTEYFS